MEPPRPGADDRKPSRREFCASLVGLAGAGLVTAARDQPSVQDAAIPSTGERIPRLGLGTWQTFDAGGDPARRRALADTLRTFVEGGGRVVDTSPMYGSSERVLGDLYADTRLRDRTWLATKVWTTGADAGVRQMQTSMQHLRADRVELMQVHNLVDWRTHLRTLRAWKEQGRVRYIGVTHYQAAAADDVLRVIRAEPVDFLQLNFSLDEAEAADRVLPECASRGVAFIANRPFGGGSSLSTVRGRPLPEWCAELGIASWAQLMLKWILSWPAVTVAIPGTSSARHVTDNLAAAHGTPLSAAARERIGAYWGSLSR